MRRGTLFTRCRPSLWWWIVLVVTVVPILGAGAQRTRDHWYPESDDATIILRSRDVFSRDVPLVGMVSTGGAALRDPELHHPGPLEFYALAPFARIPGAPVPATTIAVIMISVASVAIIGLAASRLGGPLAGCAGLLAAGLAVWGLGGDVVASVWNPDVVALPFAALVLVAAVVATGGHRWLPVLVAIGSFVAQTHLGYVGLVGLLLGWTVALAVRDVFAQTSPEVRSTQRRSLVAAGALGLLLWIPPLLQQVTGRPGNLSQIVRSLTGPGGDSVGLDGLVSLRKVIGVPFLGASPPGDLIVEVRHWAMADLLLLAIPVACAGAIVALARRSGRPLTARIAATALVVTVAGILTATRMPLAQGTLYRYYSRWMWPLGATVWLLLAVSAAQLVAQRLPGPTGSSGRRPWLPMAGVAASGFALVVALLPRPGAWEPWQVQRRAAGEVVHAAADAARAAGARHVLVKARGGTAYLSTGSAVALAVETDGIPTTIDLGTPLRVVPWGSRRAADRTPAGATTLWVVTGSLPEDMPSEARLVASAPLLDERARVRLQTSSERIGDVLDREGLSSGRTPPPDEATRERLAAVLSDPRSALDAGGLGELAARGLVALPEGLSPDDLYTLDRLRSMRAESTVRVFLVTAVKG